MKKKRPTYNARVDALTPLEKMFCLEYFMDMNQTQAAIRAGFEGTTDSAAQWASRTMKKVKVRDFIDARKKEREARIDLKADAMLNKYNALTRANIADFFTIDKKGNLHLKNISAIDPDLLIALTFNVEKKGGKESVSVGLSDKLRSIAFDRLGRYHKLFGADVNVNLSGEDLDKVVFVRASKFDTSGSDVAPH